MGRPRKSYPGEPKPHKGQMRVWWGGRWHHLGPAADPRRWQDEYRRLLADVAGEPGAGRRPTDYLVLGLFEDYLASADAPTGRANRRRALTVAEHLAEAHPDTPVAAFGPAALRAFQDHLCGLTRPDGQPRYTRAYVINLVDVVRRVWKWGVSVERVAETAHRALMTVPRPKQGQGRPGRRVDAVEADRVAATLPFLRPPVRAMVLLQWHTGARPSELCGMTVGDVVRGGKVRLPGAGLQDLDALGVWAFVPHSHKTAGKGKGRHLAFGPEVQPVLAPFLEGRKPGEYVFRPADSLAHLRAEQKATRTGAGSKKRPVPPADRKRAGGPHYTPASYYKAVVQACDRAFPVGGEVARRPGETEKAWKSRLGDRWAEVQAHRKAHRWFPYQLRHATAEDVKYRFGRDAAKAVLGHSTLAMTDWYGGESFRTAADVAKQRGGFPADAPAPPSGPAPGPPSPPAAPA